MKRKMLHQPTTVQYFKSIGGETEIISEAIEMDAEEIGSEQETEDSDQDEDMSS